jgi:hypothetical protein
LNSNIFSAAHRFSGQERGVKPQGFDYTLSELWKDGKRHAGRQLLPL